MRRDEMHALRTALSNDDLLRSAPSIFAEDKRPDRSERYAFIPTINVICLMASSMDIRSSLFKFKKIIYHL